MTWENLEPRYRLECAHCVVPLGAAGKVEGDFFPSGSAVLISPHIALAATHVLKQYHSAFEYGEPPWGDDSVSVRFSVQLGQTDRSEWFTSADGHDIALIRLLGRSSVQPPFPRIEVAPPARGERVTAYGLEKPRIDGDTWEVWPAVSRGRVLAVYHQGRERGLYSFPGFEFDSHVDPSMSGGPVFNEAGNLCGLVAGGLTASDGGPPRSYVSLIWPAMGLFFQGNGMERSAVGRMTLLWAARFGIIDALSIDRLETRRRDGKERLRLLRTAPKDLWTAVFLEPEEG